MTRAPLLPEASGEKYLTASNAVSPSGVKTIPADVAAGSEGVMIFVTSCWALRLTTETSDPPLEIQASVAGPAEEGRIPNGPVVPGTTTWLTIVSVAVSTATIVLPSPSR